MRAVILAGGRGSRLGPETLRRPKPMVELGGRPILWHIMKQYGHFGINDFVICLGWLGHVIKDYFANYLLHAGDAHVDLGSGAITYAAAPEPWRVWLAETGAETATGGRLLRAARYLENEPFCLTYGDGVSDVDLSALMAFHRNSGKLCTVTAVRPPGRFGALELSGQAVRAFHEKPADGEAWINGGFFVCEPEALEYILGDEPWEAGPLQRLAAAGELAAFRHEGFWQAMDTPRDRELLEALLAAGSAPWLPPRHE